ncbi:hypothetical protein MACJ_002412 [Theileria orientalis]|uniref:Uncharacterized protein n=1 Tax=Theileria orientalis TaxID=68886 RepID=A0A976M659_THEOR|nr:hypothetical protein MACJ_002412 [Theileria orientalis]
MGAGASNLYIYLGRKEGKLEMEGNYSVEITKEIYDPCTNYEKVSYEITYPQENKTGIWTYFAYYSVTLYTGTSYNDIGYYGFCYYYPGKEDILKGVDVYYPLMRPDLPVIVSFTTRNGTTYDCSYELLRQAGWDYPTNLERYAIKGDIRSNLAPEFRKLLKTLHFYAISEYNKDVEQVPKYPEDSEHRNYVDKAKRFHKVGFTSNCNKMHAILYTDRWFWKHKKLKMTGFDKINWNLYDGIQVYYSGDEPLLIECLNGCSDKTQFVRKNKDTDFCEVTVVYKTYQELESILEQLKKEFDKGDTSKFCTSHPSKITATLSSSDRSVTGASGTQDSSRRESVPKPSDGGQDRDGKTGREKDKKEDRDTEKEGRDGKSDTTGPSSDSKLEGAAKSEDSGPPHPAQHTGPGDNGDTLANGESRPTTGHQPTQEAQNETSPRAPSPQSGGGTSEPGSQSTHQESTSGDTGKSHNGVTHTSTDSTQTQKPEPQKTHGSTESSDGADSHTHESHQHERIIQNEEEEDGVCAPVVALGTISATIVSGSVLGAVGNYVHQVLSLIKWLT